MYSGYVNVTGTKKQLHYVGLLSQNKPISDPLMIILYGGRGCSSLVGYALEHGPYVITDGQVNFTRNPYSWNNNATVLYLETPAGTGFSTCGDEDECTFNDTSAAKDNLQAVLSLLRDKFPILKNNSLWIVGNYYGGVQVPYLMNELSDWIDEAKKLDQNAWVPNLKGQIITNGFTDWKYDGLPAFFEMSYYHGLIDDELFDFGSKKCDFSYVPIIGEHDLTKGCKDALATLNKYTKYANIWDVYAKCYKN
jgi:carboxypeptidase C (cathepsin A)